MPKDMKGVMGEFKRGELHSGSKKGKVVKSRKQAIAIGLSEQRAQGKKVAPKKERRARSARHPQSRVTSAMLGGY
jgi:hypothetical protein